MAGNPRINGPRESWIDWIRVGGALAIIVLHVTAREKVHRAEELGAFSWWTFAAFDRWTLAIYEAATRIAVPLFFMISGYLVLTRCTRKETGSYAFRKSMRTLAVALFWTVAYACWESFKGEDASIIGFLENAALGNPYYHLWFLYAIAGTYLVAPIIAPGLARLNHRNALLVAWLLPLCISTEFLLSILRTPGVFYNTSVLSLGLPFLGYTVAGYLLRDDRVISDPRRVFAVYVAALATAVFAYVGLTELHIERPDRAVFYPMAPAVVVMALSVYVALQRVDILNKHQLPPLVRRFAQDSLGIYILHPVFLDIVNHFGLVGRKPNALIGIAFTSLVVVVLTWPAVFIVRKTIWIRKTLAL